MKLFFETTRQAGCFLCMVPIGFVMSLCTDISIKAGKIQPVLDVLITLLTGISVLGGVVLLGENQLRLYHMLGMTTGAILYTQGIGKMIRLFRRKKDFGNPMPNE